MDLINKKVLAQKMQNYEFPSGNKNEKITTLIKNWQKALKDSDLEKTKEKTIQGKFLITFFENILGYIDVTSGLAEWTLIQHPKIENDSMEPDGSLGWFTKDQKLTKAVIELKDAHTPLDKKQSSRAGKLTPIEQAYLYSTKYAGCDWIIVSNFKEIRLYNKNKTQDFYEKFEVLDLLEESEFKRFYYLLCKENLISRDLHSIIDVLSEDTSIIEKDITNKFYKEYKQGRLNLFEHLLNNNSEIQKEVILEKTQKILDRLVFTLFCEDTSNLLPLNIVKNTYERATSSLSPSDERVWTEFKGLFLAIDKGNDRVKPPINAYNGGLFAYDEVVDDLHIKDNFWPQLMHLATYDFETDLNVNILGHIFEQSISDIEMLKSEIENISVDEIKSKRKKDGIYYTPEYITRYIVENTIGRYLEDHPERLDTIKVLDPACGSGAFLNQAHSFLRTQWNIAYEEGKIKSKDADFGSLFDYNPVETDKSILLNNLFGVDLNQESVEITKLALWLKTARSTQPLQNLDENIKCGNSLINNPVYDAEKAFDWHKEFQTIMNDGGFDVIVGNPPYVKLQNFKEHNPLQYKFLVENYATTQTGNFDLYIPFFERAYELLKPGGYLAFIAPSVWIFNQYGQPLRDFIKKNKSLIEFTDFKSFQVFQDATTYTAIQIFKKEPHNHFKYIDASDGTLIANKYFNISYEGLGKNSWSLISEKEDLLMKKMEESGTPLGELPCDIFVGIQTSADDFYHLTLTKEGYFSKLENRVIEIEQDILMPLLSGAEAKKFIEPNTNKFLLIPYDLESKIPKLYTKEVLRNRFPKTWEYFLRNEEFLRSRESKRMDHDEWYAYNYPKNLDRQRVPKLAVAQTVPELRLTIDKKGEFALNNVRVNGISLHQGTDLSLRYLLGILNSKAANFYFKRIAKPKDNGFYEANKQFIAPIPIPLGDLNIRIEVENDADKLLMLHTEMSREIEEVLELLEAEYGINITLKLSKIDNLGFNQLLEEIAKQKIHLSLERKEDLLGWFKNKQKKLSELKNKIRDLEEQLDLNVYRLYKLNIDDISIIDQ